MAGSRGGPAVDADGVRVHQDAGAVERGHHDRGDDRQAARATSRHGGNLPDYALRKERKVPHLRLPVAAQDAVQNGARILYRR